MRQRFADQISLVRVERLGNGEHAADRAPRLPVCAPDMTAENLDRRRIAMQKRNAALVDHVEIEVHARFRHGERRAAQLSQARFPFERAAVDVREQEAAQHAARLAFAVAGARPHIVDEGELARTSVLVEPE